MRPRVGARNLVSRLKQVVLPAPFGPIIAWMVPRATRNATPLTATNPATFLVRSSVSRIVSVLADNDAPSPRLCWLLPGRRPDFVAAVDRRQGVPLRHDRHNTTY